MDTDKIHYSSEDKLYVQDKQFVNRKQQYGCCRTMEIETEQAGVVAASGFLFREYR